MVRISLPSLKTTRILSVLLFLAAAAAVYYFSPDSHILSMSVFGNYYYSPQQIYKIAQVTPDSRKLLNPSKVIEKRLEEDPLIEDASVTISGQSLQIHVQEKLIIGYYVEDGLNYIVCSNGEILPIEDPSSMKNLIHIPLLVGLSRETIDAIVKEFQTYPEYLTRDILEKIAEILPWEESYDPNMLRMVMQDGNTVFTSIPSLKMITNYQSMLTELQGENVCLVLDSENDAIDKIACDYLYMNAEQRSEVRDALKAQHEEQQKQAEADKKDENGDQASEEQNPDEDRQDDQEQEKPDENGEDHQEGDAEQSGQDNEAQPSEAEQKPYENADDWQPSPEYSWLEFSPSFNVYRSPENGTYYSWDDSTASFVPLAE